MSDRSMFTMGFSKTQLGCCGYDELVHKPQTTSPISDASRFPKQNSYKPTYVGAPRYSSIGTTSQIRVENLPKASEPLRLRGRRDGRA